MTNSNNEWIEDLEANVEEIKEELRKMNVDVAYKFKSIEEALHRLTEYVMDGRDGGDANTTRSTGRSTDHNQQLQAVKSEIAKPCASECDVCQRTQSSALAPAGLVQPLLVPEQVWEDVSVDFVDGLPRSNGYTTIMVVEDRSSKSAHLVPLSHPYTAKLVAINDVVTLQRVLHDVVQHGEDRATTWSKNMKMMKTLNSLSSHVMFGRLKECSLGGRGKRPFDRGRAGLVRRNKLQKFPEFVTNLEDKVILRGRGIDGLVIHVKPIRMKI